ncbi:MAG: heme-binding protein [Dehalococcoidia bacterium]|nr:heme-binding protein [Dehalococcoidia bacterium]
MYQKTVLGMAETLAAIHAMLEEVMKAPDRPVAIAVTDDDGNLVAYARMDQCRRLPQQVAVKKAYTAATFRSDTGVLAVRMKETGRTAAEFGDPNLMFLQGGVVIQRPDGTVLGGIGVSGLAAAEDEAIARIGLKTMKL